MLMLLLTIAVDMGMCVPESINQSTFSIEQNLHYEQN